MEILKKITDNIKAQSIVRFQQQKLREQADGLNQQSVRLGGQMEVYLELYKEQTGNDLNDVVSSDPSVKAMIDSAQQEGMKIAAGNLPELQRINDIPVEQNQVQQNQVQQNQVQQRKLTPVQKSSGEARRPPVQVVVSDEPAPTGPGRDDD